MNLSRRKFLVGTGAVGGGLLVGCVVSGRRSVPGTLDSSFQPNAWLQITADDRVIFQLDKAEMGQGVISSLPVLMGEELDVDPARFEIQMAGIHPEFVNPVLFSQVTGASSSIKTAWQPLREAGAATRAMLVAAAADLWGIRVNDCVTDNGVITNNRNNLSLSYAEVSQLAAKFGGANYELKNAKNYKYVGKALSRVDAKPKSTGSAEFSVDVNLADAKVAVVVRCPYFGGSVKSWEKKSIMEQPDVVDAFEIHSGIAIVANGYWPARKAAANLLVRWNKGPLRGGNNASIIEGQREALAQDDFYAVVDEGNVKKALENSFKSLNAEYQLPFANHSPMEPLNATALYTPSPKGDRCEVWGGNQAPNMARAVVAHYLDINPNQVTINNTLMGGAFGRRTYPDYMGEAAAVAKGIPGVPVKLIWSREDDIKHDYYRPSSCHQVEAALDESGNLVAWKHNIATASVLKGYAVELVASSLPTWVPTGIARSMGKVGGSIVEKRDPIISEGAKPLYAFENQAVGQVIYDAGIPVGVWRSVGYSNNVFVTLCFVDEVAAAANQDPLVFRRRYLSEGSSSDEVLRLAAEKADWGNPKYSNSQGLALSKPFDTDCAMVAEVEVTGTSFTIKRIVVAVDCGIVINPDIVTAQIEGGVIYGLTAALKAGVEINDGRVQQSNFHDLPVIRMNEAPKIEVHLIESQAEPTGIGEVAVPLVAPAVANALFSATGQRLRRLPLRLL